MFFCLLSPCLWIPVSFLSLGSCVFCILFVCTCSVCLCGSLSFRAHLSAVLNLRGVPLSLPFLASVPMGCPRSPSLSASFLLYHLLALWAPACSPQALLGCSPSGVDSGLPATSLEGHCLLLAGGEATTAPRHDPRPEAMEREKLRDPER